MGYNYAIDHTQVNYTPGNSGRLYIVIHYTGNLTDTAKNNANYFRDADRGASAHLFVDESDVYHLTIRLGRWELIMVGTCLGSVPTQTPSALSCVP